MSTWNPSCARMYKSAEVVPYLATALDTLSLFFMTDVFF